MLAFTYALIQFHLRFLVERNRPKGKALSRLIKRHHKNLENQRRLVCGLILGIELRHLTA